MYTIIGTKEFEVKETNGKFFYFSKLAHRWFPVKKANVVFESDPMDDFNYVGSHHHY